MDGFLIIDKPSGLTSFDVVARVRRAALAVLGSVPHGAKKLRVGHLGTLDPLATGVLVVGVGDATKLIEYLMGEDKVYEAHIELGKVSDTYDLDGEVTVQVATPVITREELETALLSFVGEISQVPPVFSAIKVGGRRAYDRVRKGETLMMEPRVVTIHSIKVRGFQPPFVTLEVHSSSGTYIRSLAHDLGQALGCGGLITALRRLSVGSFMLNEAIVLPEEGVMDVESSLIPLERVVQEWPSVVLNQEQVNALRNGQSIVVPSSFTEQVGRELPLVGLFDGRLVALLMVEGRFLKVVKNFL